MEEDFEQQESRPDASVAKAPEATIKSEVKAVDTTQVEANQTPTPIVGSPAHRRPVIVVFGLPEISRSQFGGPVRPEREFVLPEDVDDRFEMLNADGLRAIPPASSRPWQIATKTGISRLDSPSTLAQLVQKDARTWRFGWTKDASKNSTRLDALRDVVLKFQARDSRPIFVLLRAIEARNDRPLAIVVSQPLLFDRLEPRIRRVAWAQNPQVLTDTKWKLSIRRWRLVIMSSDTDEEVSRHQFDSEPIGVGKNGSVPMMKTEQDLVPGELTFKLSMDPESPDTIVVWLVPNRERAIEGRRERAAQWKAFEESTPNDSEGLDRDPIESRRSKLRKLEAAEMRDDQTIKTVKDEIRALKELNESRQIDVLLTKPVRAELSVVIGLDIDDSTTLEIARIGEFAE